MRSIGFLLLILGAGSFILEKFDMQFRLLSWMDDVFKDNVVIARIGLAVIGAILIFLSMRKGKAEDTTPPAAPPQS
jgi:uncharacterized membrane protein